MNMSKMNMIEGQNTGTKFSDENDDEEVFIDDEREYLDCNDLFSEDGFDEDLKDLIEGFVNDKTMDGQIDSLFDEIQQSGVVNFKKEKDKILLLLQAYLSRMSGLDNSKATKLLKAREKAIGKHLDDLERYFRNHNLAKPQGKGLFSKIKNSFSNMSLQAKKDFRNMVKRFAIYEVYQAISPRRIAGESKLTNFIHNMILGGLKRAAKYTGGKANDLKHYDKNFILKLQKLHNQLSREKTEINIGEITAPTTPIGKMIDKQKGRGF